MLDVQRGRDIHVDGSGRHSRGIAGPNPASNKHAESNTTGNESNEQA